MVERIVPTTPALAERERQAIEDLVALFPDGNVSGLDTVDRSLGKRLSKLYVALGYESRAEMFEALGFEQVKRNLGGRPAIDHEEIIAELLSRYEGMDKPETIGILSYENPDLKGKLKTLSTKANEIFGRSLSVELKERGLITGGRQKTEVSEDEIQEVLDILTEKYRDAALKPKTMAELKADNPENKRVIAAFNDRCRLIFGITASKKLIELGIFDKPKGAVIDASADEVYEAVDEIAALVMKLADNDKPATLTMLQKAYPEQGEYIKAGKKMGLVDKAPLQRLGILAPTKTLLRREGIRGASAASLASDYVSLGLPALVKPGDSEAAMLPPQVVGIDAIAGAELREILLTTTGGFATGLKVGDELSCKVKALMYEWGGSYTAVQLQTTTGTRFTYKLCEGDWEVPQTPLDELVETKVVAVSSGDGITAAQVRVRFVAALRGETIAYVLRERGIVTVKDLRGSMEWRYRLKKAAHSQDEDAVVDSGAGEVENRAEELRGSAPSNSDKTAEHAATCGTYAFETDPQVADSFKRYLRIIADFANEPTRVRSTDVVDRLGVSKATFSEALGRLRIQGFVDNSKGWIELSENLNIEMVDGRYGFMDDPRVKLKDAKYLEAIVDLVKGPARVRSVDVVERVGCSKSTFSSALSEMRAQGFVDDSKGWIELTDKVDVSIVADGSGELS